MNPQQFSNMAGMGNGMPGNMQQMNPAMINSGMAGMAGNMRQQPGMQMQGGMQMNSNNAQIQRLIYQALSQQGAYTTGWQAAVTVPERGAQIRLIVDSLRLVRPPVDPPRATEVAIQFERKAFIQSTSKEQYLQECNSKLARIRDQRAQQMNATNMAGMQDGMQMQNQNMMQQMAQNMNQGMNMGMNPQQMQNPAFNQRAPNMAPNQVQMMQNQGNPQGNPIQKQPDGLTSEDNVLINQRAAELAKGTPKDKMRQIVDQMNPQLRASLEERNVDPIIYYFRMMATREFRKTKDQGGQTQMMPQMPQNRTMQQGQPMLNDMGRFQTQQNEAIRMQQEGDMVVPASNNQGVGPDQLRLQQQMMARTQGMNQQNPQAMAERQRQMAMQAAKMQQVNALRQQGQQPDGVMQPSQTPQQANASLNMQNRPVGPNGQEPSPQNNSRPPSRVPQQQQQSMQVPGQISAQDLQKREDFLARFPVPLQNILRQKPANTWGQIVQQYQASLKRNASQQAAMAQGQQNQANAQFLQGPTPMQQSLSNGGMAQTDGQPSMQNMAQMNQQMMQRRAMQQQAQMNQAQQQQQQQQQQQNKPMPQQQQGVPLRPLQPVEMQYMDNQPVNTIILNNIRDNSRVPLPMLQNGINWFSLKQWASQNPSQPFSIQHVNKWQAQAFLALQKQKAAMAMAANANMAQGGPQQQQQPQQQVQQNPSMSQTGGQIPQITAADIAQARQTYPKLQSIPDEQVRTMLLSRQQQAMMQNSRQNAQTQAQQGQQQQPTQRQPAQKAPAQQPARPPSHPQAPQQQNVAANNAANKTPQPNAPQQGMKADQPMTQEQYDKLPPAQKQLWLRAQQRNALVKKIMAITNQMQVTLPPPTKVALDEAQRTKMIEKLTTENAKQMLGRLDSFLLAYYEMTKDDAELKTLIRYRALLYRQYDQASLANKTFVPTTNFTLTPEQVEEILNDLSAKFHQTAAQIPRPAAGQQLTPENLKQLEAQEQERKKSVGTKGKDVPPAPTSAQPPFSFAGERGQGAPKYAAPGLKQEDLKLPGNKRQKKNPPTPSTTAPTPAAPTPVATQQGKNTAPQAQSFNCGFNTCARHTKGFASQMELDQHVATTHSMEPVGDPLAFLDDSLRHALNLDENFKQIKKASAQPMVKTSSFAKAESRPGTPSAMARIPSTRSMYMASPAMPQEEEDPWQHSNISPAQIDEIFGDMEWEHVVPAADPGLQKRFVQQYMETDDWKRMFAKKPEKEAERPSPPTAKDASPERKVDPMDDFLVDVTGIDGLDITGFEELVATGHPGQPPSDENSPFEMVGVEDDTTAAEPESSTKPARDPRSVIFTEENDAEFLRENGINPLTPYSQLNEHQKGLYDIVAEPIRRDQRMADLMRDDTDWEEIKAINWEEEEAKIAEEGRLNRLGRGTPGVWNGDGFNPFV